MRVLDSDWEPSPAQVAKAKAEGWQAWLGYLQTKSGVYLAGPWSDAAFAVVRSGGLLTGAYVSGWDDPVALKTKAAALGIPIILDVESGIRGDGLWVDPFLEASGAAIYGDIGVMTAHATHGHPAYIFAGYPGGPQAATWPTYGPVLDPARPTGWQYLGTTQESFGVVDLSNFDDAVLQEEGEEMTILRMDPDELAFVSGLPATTTWTAVSPSASSIKVICYDLGGKPLGATQVLPLGGNQPNVQGPTAQTGLAGAIGAVGICTLGFEAGGGGAVVTLS